MPVVVGQYEMDELAKKLAKMRFNRAKAHIRRYDPQNQLMIFRVVVGHGEFHTKYILPNRGLQVILVEKHETYGKPNHLGIPKTRFRYVEARVEGIPEKIRQRMEEEANPEAYID
jgi:hypothetical protein